MDANRNLFLSLVCVLLGFGILMVYSASITSRPTEFEQVYLSRHLKFLVLGVLAAGTCALLPARQWERLAPWLFAATVLLLVAVLVPGVGARVNGAQRWLRVGSFSLQPSEIAKVTLPLLVCRLLCARRDRLHRLFAGTVPLLWPIALVTPLVLKQPDLGTALFLCGTGGLVLLFGGWPLRHFLIGGALAVPASASLLVMRPYQLERITGFLALWADVNHAPYQLKQSLVSLGAGGLTGVGLGLGWQKLSFLPEANTDFVFAVVGEELGLLGTLALVVLWCALYLTGLHLLRHLPRQSFEFIASLVLLTQLVLQAMLNVAVVTAMVPPKGISHPLISYGGSSLVMSLVSLGILISLSRRPTAAVAHCSGNAVQ